MSPDRRSARPSAVAARMLGALLAAAAALVAPAAAQSIQKPPVIEIGTQPMEIARLPWLTQEARDWLTARQAEFTQGRIEAFVVVSAPDGTWDYRSSLPDKPEASVADLARQALEACEYHYGLPCRILAINNRSTRRPDGSYAEQPQLLSHEPTHFDPRRVPFIRESERSILRNYATNTATRAMMISTGGYWAWREGETVEVAIAEARKGCEGEPKVVTCMLYAVDGVVTLDPRR